MASCHFVRVANKILNVNRGFTCILLARMMHSHHGGTSICHASTRKMHQTQYLWSKLNTYLKHMCSIFSLLCIFQRRLIRFFRIIDHCRHLHVLWNFSFLTISLSSSLWTLAAGIPEVLKRIDMVYYVDFPWHEQYNTKEIKYCRVFLHRTGKSVLRCEEHISLLRPLHIIREWQRQQNKTGFLSLTINESGIKNAHVYIEKIQSIPPYLPSVHGQSSKEGCVTGRFIRHAVNVNRYQFMDQTTGQVSSVWSTPNHPFYVKNRHEFIPVNQISSTDLLISENGDTVTLDSLATLKNTGQIKKILPRIVYNIELDRRHMYFVGMHKILVHNICLKEYFEFLQENGFVYPQKGSPDKEPVSIQFDLSNKEHIRILSSYSKSDKKSLSDLKSTNNIPYVIRTKMNGLGFVAKKEYLRLMSTQKLLTTAIPMGLDDYMKLLAHVPGERTFRNARGRLESMIKMYYMEHPELAVEGDYFRNPMPVTGTNSVMNKGVVQQQTEEDEFFKAIEHEQTKKCDCMFREYDFNKVFRKFQANQTKYE